MAAARDTRRAQLHPATVGAVPAAWRCGCNSARRKERWNRRKRAATLLATKRGHRRLEPNCWWRSLSSGLQQRRAFLVAGQDPSDWAESRQ